MPVGFVAILRRKFCTDNLIFSPESSREGNALYDNLCPSRMIVGDVPPRGQAVAESLCHGATQVVY